MLSEWAEAYLYDPSNDSFEIVKSSNCTRVPAPAKDFELEQALDVPTDDGHTSFIYTTWENDTVISRESPREIIEISTNIEIWKLEVSEESEKHLDVQDPGEHGIFFLAM